MGVKTNKEVKDKKTLNLALQGGGAHGAFTWGVLEKLLEDERFEFEAITASSSGAMNAIVMAQGLMSGGRKEAISLLEAFWKKVSNVASMTPLTPKILDRFLNNKNLNNSPYFMAADYLTRILSPYQFNFFDFNPLKNILAELIEFDKIYANSKLKLFLNATNVKTGKIKVFNSGEGITLDMVMATACLPYLYKAVEIEGESYWDGGYSGNPALFPLFYNCDSSDVVIVQINPLNTKDVPTTAPDIMDRINEISFNSSLMREMRAIEFVKRLLTGNAITKDHYKDMHIHMIGNEEIISSLGCASKLNADWEFLNYLRELGRQTANDWIKANYDKIGKDSTIDLVETFL